MSRAWERASQGRISALVGETLGPPPPALDSVVIRVVCRRGATTLGPLLEAREKVERLLDASRPLLDLAADRVRVELRRHLLGETDQITRDAGLCDALQRLSKKSRRPCVLVFDAVDLADHSTLDALEEVVRRVRIGMILVLREAPTDPQLIALLELVAALGGEEAVIRAPGLEGAEGSAASGLPGAPTDASRSAGSGAGSVEAAPPEVPSEMRSGDSSRATPDPDAAAIPGIQPQREDDVSSVSGDGAEQPSRQESLALPTPHLAPLPELEIPSDVLAPLTEPESAQTARVYHLPALPRSVVQVLRAGALIGVGFEAELVADLLDHPELEVLEHLQHAFDEGVPIEDQGDGRFVFQVEVHEALRAQILPSLAAAWHRKLARLLSEERMAPPAMRIEATSAAPAMAGAHDDAKGSDTSAGRAGAAGLSDGDAVSWSEGSGQGSPLAIEGEEAAVSVQAGATEGEGSAHRPSSSDVPIFGGAAAHTVVPETMAGPDPESPQRYRHIDDTPSGTELPFGSSQDEVTPSETTASRSTDESLAGPERSADHGPRPAWETPRAREDLEGGDRAPLLSGREDSPAGPSSAEAVPVGQSWGSPERAVFRSSAGLGDGRADPLLQGSPRMARTVAPEARKDPARAAAHLLAIGELDGAAERLLAASDNAERLGAFSQAVSFARQAIAVLERLPINQARRQLLVRCWLALGRLTRDLQGRGPEFSLATALKILEGAQQLLQPDDPMPLQAELLAAIAGVLYDLGDRKSLDQALDALTQASRLLQASGDPTGAARLLNDQAAVWVRLGDPVRAWYLLGESRKVFESRAETDRVAMEELAETDHLLARLTFHVPARPGKEAEAVEVGLNHARAAEGAYKRLKAHRALARVWETQGRLHLMAGRIRQAQEKLQMAIEYQEKMGDLLGLARTVGVMAELLASVGELEQALSLLRESIVMNVEQGSSQGLETTQQAFETLLTRLQPADRDRVADQLQATQQQLARASRWIARRD